MATTDEGQRRRWAPKARKVVAAGVGMALVGGAAFAAFQWFQSRGSVDNERLDLGMTLDAAVSGDTVPAGPCTGNCDFDYTGAMVGYSLADASVSVTDATAGTFGVVTSDAYQGWMLPVDLTYTAAGTTDMKITGLRVNDTNGDAFAPGTAPAIAVLDDTAAPLTNCGSLKIGPAQPSTSTTITVWLVFTDDPGDFVVDVEWSPNAALQTSVSQADCRLASVSPVTAPEVGLA